MPPLWFLVALAVLFSSCGKETKPVRSQAPNAAGSAAQEAVFPIPEPPVVRHESFEQPLPPGEKVTPIHVSGDVVPPERNSAPGFDLAGSGCDPSEPFELVFKMVITVDGQVTDVKALRPLSNQCFERHLTEVISAWRFRPATLNGQPVPVIYSITATIRYR